MKILPAIERQEFFSALTRYTDACIGEESTLGLLLIDVVNLAQINHSGSYTHGDEVLCECYAQLQSISRLPNTVFRIGNHQFVFILPELKNPTFIALAINKVSKVLAEVDTLNDIGLDLDVKIGIALNKGAKYGVEETLLSAEVSLKQTKANKGLFNVPRSEKGGQQSQVFEEVFANKLKENDFELYYQPKINLQTGAIESVEALLRWQIPGEGFISPEVAVDIAEKTGQSFALTKWVMHTAIRQIKTWEKLGLILSVAVNIPANLVQSPELFTLVQDSLAIWGVNKSQLTLEITESAIIEDKEAGFDNLSKLKEFGVKLSIDDFGTGYSSLSYFKHIPANELKIDQSFVLKMLTNLQDRQIVTIIIEIAQLFGLKLVAEGIEDQQTYDYLKQLGCDYGQGYHMARPMPAEDFYAYYQEKMSK